MVSMVISFGQARLSLFARWPLFGPLSLFAPDYYYAYAYYCEKAILPQLQLIYCCCRCSIKYANSFTNVSRLDRVQSLDFCLFFVAKSSLPMQQPFSFFCFLCSVTSASDRIDRSINCSCIESQAGLKSPETDKGDRRTAAKFPTSNFPTANC